MIERELAGEFLHKRLAAGDRIGIAIERDDLGALFQNGPRIAACPECAIEDHGAGSRHEVREHLCQHHRDMPNRSANGIAFAAMIRHRTHTPHHEEPRPRFLNSSLAAIWAAENSSGRHS